MIFVFCALMSLGFTSNPELKDKSPLDKGYQDRNMEKVALRLYKSSLKFYYERAYWKAARELIILLDYYPAFSQADGVLYHLGECLYSMEMLKSSHKMFRFLVTKFPDSEYLVYGLYGLQRIQYQMESYEESLKIYSAILANYPKSGPIDGIYYFGGMAQFHQNDYDAAIETLGKVSSRSEYFDHSLYTVGLSHLKKKASTRLWQLCVR